MSRFLALVVAGLCLAASCAAVADDAPPTTQERVGYALSRAHSATLGDKQALASLQTDAAQDAAAEFGLGEYYVLTQDYPQSLTWFKKSAAQHFVGGYYGLGMAYDCGNGVPVDYAQAMHFYLQAAELPEAEMRIGDLYMKGQGVKQDSTQAISWYTKAGDAGSIPADLKLGEIFQSGLGLKDGDAQALDWYRKAADQGDAMGEFRLGVQYEKPGRLEDYARALPWLQKASQQGVAGAQYELGLLYLHGTGAPADAAKAVQQFQMAANQGLRKAQTYLAKCFADGTGVPPDPFRAYQWYSIAEMSLPTADPGHAMYEQSLAPLAKQLGPAETARAKQAAEAWHTAHPAAKPPEPSF